MTPDNWHLPGEFPTAPAGAGEDTFSHHRLKITATKSQISGDGGGWGH